MLKQVIFSSALLITIVIFFFTVSRFIAYFRCTRPAFPVGRLGQRFRIMLRVAFGQTKIFRRPVIGLFHALVFWGFCVILVGSIEMVIDGVSGVHRSLVFLGPVYNIITAAADIFAVLVTVSILVFLARRLFFNIRRFSGIEMKHISHLDAGVSLILILLLMISLAGMNMFYIVSSEMAGMETKGCFPVSDWLARHLPSVPLNVAHALHEACWWSHILLIFFFANYLPYSKHFHVFMSIPNVFLSRLDPMGKIPNMPHITDEIRTMLDPSSSAIPPQQEATLSRFGVKDVEDITWKNYLDALSCTECGRCTSVCPANITGKKLSPRKIIMDVRARMKEKGPGLVARGKEYDDGRSLIRDYVSEEELWACTTCNACATECPVNINHPTLIVDMRRYLVMEEARGPAALNAVFSNIENNGAPWQFSREDRMLWAADLYING